MIQYICHSCGSYNDKRMYDQKKGVCHFCKLPLIEEDIPFGERDYDEIEKWIYNKYIKGDPLKEIIYAKSNEESQRSIEELHKKWERERAIRNTPRCPRCNSTAITTGARGYSMISGFIGSSKTVNRCGNCGYKWEPKKR